MAKASNTTSLGFEEKIWSAADTLRGNLSASEYEGVVLVGDEESVCDACLKVVKLLITTI